MVTATAADAATGPAIGAEATSPDAAAAGPRTRGRRARAHRRRHRRLRRWVLGLAFCVLVAVGGVATAFTVVDLPQVPRMAEASVLYYSDGVTELARLGVQDRTPVHHSDVPLVVRRAVLAAEDRAFYDHSGISWRGVARAAVSNATGEGGTQGASTITQQYVKNTYLTHERTLGRKVEEAVLSVKVERRHSKDEILQGYLNTIYFGRGAYGIDAAARTYFNTRVHDLTAEQGAVLAASIKSPLGYDPGRHRAAAEERWRYVLGTMAELGWLTPAQAQDAKYPAIAAERSPLTGPVGYIVARAEQEIAARGVTEQELRVSGFRIVTTIDRAAQAAAERAMSMAVGHAAADTRGALVQVQSGTGAILAYWGGDRGYGFLDYAQGSYPSGGVLAAFEDAAIVPPRYCSLRLLSFLFFSPTLCQPSRTF